MNEANPYIERFAKMNPVELDGQLDVAKALLPDSSIVRSLAIESIDAASIRALAFSNMWERRANSEGLRRGLMILDGLKPRMIVTGSLKDDLTTRYSSRFGVGISQEDKGSHLFRVLFYNAKFPEELDLVGAIFVPEKARLVEAAIFKTTVIEQQMVRDILADDSAENHIEEPDVFHKESARWLKQMRELHGPDVM